MDLIDGRNVPSVAGHLQGYYKIDAHVLAGIWTPLRPVACILPKPHAVTHRFDLKSQTLIKGQLMSSCNSRTSAAVYSVRHT